jgi:sialate O-acetylesterase
MFRGAETRGFAISANGKKDIEAEAMIKNGIVIVRSEKIKTPSAIAYGWADNPDASLYNRYGLPLVPFKSPISSTQWR